MTAGTIMHRSHLPLKTWLMAVHIVTSHSNGISALQLQAQLGLGSYKSAWLLLHKLRRAMVDPDRSLLEDLVEIDEATLPFRTVKDPTTGGQGRSRQGKMRIAGAVEHHPYLRQARIGGVGGRAALPHGASYEVDAVPTGVAVRAGRVFVALFGGFPFVAGGGAVHSVAANGGGADERIEVRDLNSPTDIAFDARGRLLVVEMGLFDMDEGFQPGSGRLLRIDLATAQRSVLLDGLSRSVTVVPMDDGAALIVQLGGEILALSPVP